LRPDGAGLGRRGCRPPADSPRGAGRAARRPRAPVVEPEQRAHVHDPGLTAATRGSPGTNAASHPRRWSGVADVGRDGCRRGGRSDLGVVRASPRLAELHDLAHGLAPESLELAEVGARDLAEVAEGQDAFARSSAFFARLERGRASTGVSRNVASVLAARPARPSVSGPSSGAPASRSGVTEATWTLRGTKREASTPRASPPRWGSASGDVTGEGLPEERRRGRRAPRGRSVRPRARPRRRRRARDVVDPRGQPPGEHLVEREGDGPAIRRGVPAPAEREEGVAVRRASRRGPRARRMLRG
jgi:hypothetical protein